MKKSRNIAIVATGFATIALSLLSLTSCEGRKMSNMTPNGDTVEVMVERQTEVIDSFQNEVDKQVNEVNEQINQVNEQIDQVNEQLGSALSGLNQGQE